MGEKSLGNSSEERSKMFFLPSKEIVYENWFSTMLRIGVLSVAIFLLPPLPPFLRSLLWVDF
jgi:hypothetical protein